MGDGVNMTDPMSLSNETLMDLLKTTLADYPWDGQYAMTFKYNNYPIGNQIIRDNRMELDGGVSIVRNVQLRTNGSAAFIAPYQSMSPNVVDTQARLLAQWAIAKADFSISRQEMMRNRGKAQLINLADSRRRAALNDLADMLEEQVWTAGNTIVNGVQLPMGIPYWFPPITGAQVTSQGGAGAGSHQGQAATGFSDCAGIDVSIATNSRWRSFNDVWSNSSGALQATDVVTITRMLRRLRFQGPMLANENNLPGNDAIRIYAHEKIVQAAEDRARKQNDSNGRDIGMYAGQAMIANIPIVWVPQIDSDTTYPLYALNHEEFKAFVMSGDFFRFTEPMNSRDLPDVFTTFVFLSFNLVCLNRRSGGGVISYVAAA